jgi:glycosyltransferase involved in cell wall biosynthesis
MTMPLTQTAMPKVTIAIPTLNRRAYLQLALESAFAQTYGNIEVVVSNNASTDETAGYLATCADPRLRVLHQPKLLRMVENFNACISAATGEYILMLSDDDTIAPSCVEKLLAACLRTGKPLAFCERDFIFEGDVSGAQRDLYNWHKQWLRSQYHASTEVSAEQAIRIGLKYPSYNPVGEPTVTIIKMSLFGELGGFDEALIQLCDHEFWYRVMVKYGAARVPESLAAFRVHAQSATAWNIHEKELRCRVLDPLIIRYRFAFGAHFKPMRDAKVSWKNSLLLRVKCASDAAYAWGKARQASHAEAADSKGRALAEWKAVESLCPGLRILVALGLIINVCREAWMRLSRKVRQPSLAGSG